MSHLFAAPLAAINSSMDGSCTRNSANRGKNWVTPRWERYRNLEYPSPPDEQANSGVSRAALVRRNWTGIRLNELIVSKHTGQKEQEWRGWSGSACSPRRAASQRTMLSHPPSRITDISWIGNVILPHARGSRRHNCSHDNPSRGVNERIISAVNAFAASHVQRVAK